MADDIKGDPSIWEEHLKRHPFPWPTSNVRVTSLRSDTETTMSEQILDKQRDEFSARIANARARLREIDVAKSECALAAANGDDEAKRKLSGLDADAASQRVEIETLTLAIAAVEKQQAEEERCLKAARAVEVEKHRLVQIEKRLAELDDRLGSVAGTEGKDFSYRDRELMAERRELQDLRRTTEGRINGHSAELTPTQQEAEAQRQARLDAWVQEQTANTLAFAEKLESEGDYRQARIHRMDLLRIRERLDAKMH